MLVKQHEWRAGGKRIGHRPFAADLPAQQPRQLIGALADQLGIGELQHLPGAVGRCTAAALAPLEHAQSDTDASAPPESCTRTRLQRSIPAARRPGRQIVERLADDRRRQRQSRRARSSSPSSERQIATGPGQGSANTATRDAAPAAPRPSVGRSSSSACAGPSGGRQRRRRGGAARERQVEHIGIDRARPHARDARCR